MGDWEKCSMNTRTGSQFVQIYVTVVVIVNRSLMRQQAADWEWAITKFREGRNGDAQGFRLVHLVTKQLSE